MLWMMRPSLSLTWPVAVASAGVAAVFACCTRWWLIAPPNGAVTTAAAFVSGAVVGALLTQTIREGRSRLLAEHAIITVIVGAMAGAGVTLACDPELTVPGLFSGVAIALLMLPVLNAVAHFAHRALRSRAHSLVGGVDRRGPWLATAGALGAASFAGAICALTMNSGWLPRRAELVQVPLLVAGAGVLVATLVVLLDLRVERRLRAVAMKHADLRSGHGAGAVTAATLDVGIGNATWVDPALQIENYREAPLEDVAIVGDVSLGPELVRDSLRQSTLVCAAVGCAFVVSFCALLAAS